MTRMVGIGRDLLGFVGIYGDLGRTVGNSVDLLGSCRYLRVHPDIYGQYASRGLSEFVHCWGNYLVIRENQQR